MKEKREVFVKGSGEIIYRDEVIVLKEQFEELGTMPVSKQNKVNTKTPVLGVHENIPINQICIFKNGQRFRKFMDAEIKRHAKNFDWLLCKNLVGARIGKWVFLIDGQGRARSACFHPEITHLPVDIKTHIKTKNEIIEEYKRYNYEQKNLTSSDKFWARCETGDPKAVEMKTFLQSINNWTISQEKDHRERVFTAPVINRIEEMWENTKDENRKEIVSLAVKFAEQYTDGKMPTYFPRAAKIIYQTYKLLQENSVIDKNKKIFDENLLFLNLSVAQKEKVKKTLSHEFNVRNINLFPELRKGKTLLMLGRDYFNAFHILATLEEERKQIQGIMRIRGKKTNLLNSLKEAVSEIGDKILEERKNRKNKASMKRLGVIPLKHGKLDV